MTLIALVCVSSHSCQGSFLPLSPRVNTQLICHETKNLDFLEPNKVEGRSQVKVAGGSSQMAVPSLPSLSPLLTDWMSSGWSGHLLSDQSEFSVDGNCFRTAQEELRRSRPQSDVSTAPLIYCVSRSSAR